MSATDGALLDNPRMTYGDVPAKDIIRQVGTDSIMLNT